MSGAGEGFAAAASEFIGAPFRLRGRDPATGLDCIGLVAAALARSGRAAAAPAGYALRQSDVSHLLPFAANAGFERASGAVQAGDVLLVRPGPAQFHLAIAAPGGGFIHAHAGLGRVVLSPAPLEWPTVQHWRLS